MNKKETAAKDPKTQAFIRHLEKVSKKVDAWPQWKKDVLDACPENRQTQGGTDPSNGEMKT